MPPLIQIAQTAADAIAAEAAKQPRPDSEQKADGSPVTRADRASNTSLLAGLNRLSDLPCVSEEEALPPPGQWQHYWLLDPLDGTMEFIDGSDEFTVNIALISDGYPLLGVMHCPALDATLYGGQQLGAWSHSPRSTEPICTSRHDSGHLRILHSRRAKTAGIPGERAKALDYRVTSIPCGSSLKLALLASGKADFYPRLGPTSAWDIAAGQAILEGAGGAVLNLDGPRLAYGNGTDWLNPHFVALGDPDWNWAALIP